MFGLSLTELLIVSAVAVLIFGAHLPALRGSLRRSVHSLRCPQCAWVSLHPTHCLHCGRLKRRPPS